MKMSILSSLLSIKMKLQDEESNNIARLLLHDFPLPSMAAVCDALSSFGWEEVAFPNPHMRKFIKNSLTLAFPGDETLLDYPRNIVGTIESLADFEGVDALQLYARICGLTSDSGVISDLDEDCSARRIRWILDTGIAGCTRSGVIEVDDDASDDEIEMEVRAEAFRPEDLSWEEV